MLNRILIILTIEEHYRRLKSCIMLLPKLKIALSQTAAVRERKKQRKVEVGGGGQIGLDRKKKNMNRGIYVNPDQPQPTVHRGQGHLGSTARTDLDGALHRLSTSSNSSLSEERENIKK